MSKGAYGIDTDKAMDEQSPPMNESGKVGGAKKNGRMNSPMGPEMEGVDSHPMPHHGANEHPLVHLQNYRHVMPKK